MDSGNNSEKVLRDAVGRTVNLLREIDVLREDIKDIVDQASKATGFSKSHIRKVAMIDKKGVEEYHADQEALDEVLRVLGLSKFL